MTKHSPDEEPSKTTPKAANTPFQEAEKESEATPLRIFRVGIISDTHGYLPQEALDIFDGNYAENQIYEHVLLAKKKIRAQSGLPPKKDLEAMLAQARTQACELIIHAGDIEAQSTIDTLEAYAPVVAVNGNCDYYDYFTKRGYTRALEAFTFKGVDIAVLHKPSDLRNAFTGSAWQPASVRSTSLRIHGHTHVPHVTPSEGFTTLCPGSPCRPYSGSRRSVAAVYLCEGILLAADLIAL